MLQWIAAVVFVALNQVDHSLSGDPERDFPRLPCQKEYISSFVMAGSIILLVVGDIVAISTAENIHTTRLLCVFVGTLLAASILACSVLLFSIYSYSEFIRTNNVRIFVNTVGPGGELFQSFDLIVALVSLFFPFICIHGHIALRRRFRGLICGSEMVKIRSLRKMWDATELHWNVPDKTKA
uniref:Transmembrane protein n=1 Tax=Heterorhabditis bacteriophora TaxID=37862 RepID=A0A1I7WBW7_HETBA